MVMASLAVAHCLQDVTGLSIKKITHTPRSIRTIQIHLAGQTITASNPITPQAQAILDVLQLKPADYEPTWALNCHDSAQTVSWEQSSCKRWRHCWCRRQGDCTLM
ncbi:MULTISPECIES: hypothetical protein [Actinomyces]|uniref:Uncharacterized protein n=1 Tax=Actinomyces respiraculi TaxID=2744574 RepID=A0A7T0LKG2_9ACTO|nr:MULTISPECIES: hypothetical protein [Actinomyces]QPL05419.1 hypothetical protein ID810_12135 [Actinomyces respiraculi]